ncbi:unnamed protein product [Moneuplotes crassus]|uniref:Uncharacterized protein n=1 Tax=Euplotes crassus TaxID=5936 RepID=A0AAD1XA46_EUPCR|nr:unnamed protein product [Moneuplotes crassus]
MNSSLHAFRKYKNFLSQDDPDHIQQSDSGVKIETAQVSKHKRSKPFTAKKHLKRKFNDYLTRKTEEVSQDFQSVSPNEAFNPSSLTEFSSFGGEHQTENHKVQTSKEDTNFLDESFGNKRKEILHGLLGDTKPSSSFRGSKTPAHARYKNKKLIKTPKNYPNSPQFASTKSQISKNEGTPVWKRLYNQSEIMLEKKNKAKFYHDYVDYHNEQIECTFQPKTNSGVFFSPSSGDSDSWINADAKKTKKKGKRAKRRSRFLNKSMNEKYHNYSQKWREEKDTQIKSKRKQRASKIMEECTFKPNLNKSMDSHSMTRSRGRKNLNNHSGVKDHIGRVKKALWEKEIATKIKEKGHTQNCTSRDRILKGKDPSIKTPRITIPLKKGFNKRFVLNDLDTSTNGQFNITNSNKLLQSTVREQEVFNFARDLSISDLSDRYQDPEDFYMPKQNSEFVDAVRDLHSYLHA